MKKRRQVIVGWVVVHQSAPYAHPMHDLLSHHFTRYKDALSYAKSVGYDKAGWVVAHVRYEIPMQPDYKCTPDTAFKETTKEGIPIARDDNCPRGMVYGLRNP